MADTSLIIGNGNWAVKETSLLGYNIIQSKYVPIEMTVSRNTTATRVNSAGLIELVPRNLLTYSNTFSDASWTRTNCSITPNNTISPDGSVNASKLTSNTTNDNFLYKAPTAANGIYTFSCFVKYFDTNTINISLTDFVAGQAFGTFNFSSGTFISVVTTGAWTNTTTNVITLPNGWFKISITSQKNAGTVVSSRIDSFAVGTSVYIYGAQTEQGPTATEYFPTTDRFNIPRVDYLNSTTGSLLVEPTRTNEVLYSEQFDNVSWAKSSVTISANNTTSPSGVVNADKMVEDVGSSSKYVSSSSFPANTYTASIYVKASNKTFFWMSLDGSVTAVFFNLSTGTIAATGIGNTGTIASVGNGWFCCSITRTNAVSSAMLLGTSDSSLNYISNGNGVDGVFLWGCQVEIGANATSYIPTVAGPISRTADGISKTGISSLIGQTEGTIYVEVNLTNSLSTKRIIYLSDGTTNNEIRITSNAQTVGDIQYAVRLSGTLVVNNFTPTNVYTNGVFKIAASYKLNDFVMCINGGAPVITATSGGVPACNRIDIGSQLGSSNFLSDRIKSVQLYKTALSPGQLQTLTT